MKGQSPLADTKRGKANSIYLFGEQGIASVDELWYDDCLSRFGFPFEQHQEIVECCREFLEDWCRPDINPKNVRASFRALETDVTPDLFVDWYTHLCYDLKRYDVCLMPFDNIVLHWEYVGLCYPGVGEVRYLAMGEALFSILDRLLPRDNGVIMDCTTSLLRFRHDGYRLLFMIMSRLLPVFCPSKPADPPRWADVRNIALMAKYWNLYFRFVAKKGADFNPIERSLLFLDSLQEHSLLGVVASLKGGIQSFSAGLGEFDDIPPNACTPHHRRARSNFEYYWISPHNFNDTCSVQPHRPPLLVTPASRADITIPNIQGAEFVDPVVNTTASRSPAPRRPPRRPAAPRIGNGLVCRACLRKNHEEVACRDLAKLLILTHRIDKLPADVKRKVLESYYKFYGVSSTPTISHTYSSQLESFCSERGISEDDLLHHFDWDFYCDATSQDNDAGFGTVGAADDE
jgi:hypothetical protein